MKVVSHVLEKKSQLRGMGSPLPCVEERIGARTEMLDTLE